MPSDDIKMLQNPQVMINQIVKHLPEGGNNFFIISNVQQVGDQGFNFEQFLESLPAPRMKYLVDQAKEISLRKFPNKADAARWLGVSRPSVYTAKVLTDSKGEKE